MPGDRIRIGEAAAQAEVSIQTLRYYERRGLLKEVGRRPSGYREYSAEVVRQVRLIKWLQQLGFTLDEIKELRRWREQPAQGGTEVRARAAAKLEEIEDHMHRLEEMREALRAVVSCACGGSCPILRAALNGQGADVRAAPAPAITLLARLAKGKRRRRAESSRVG
jgi:MerR family mercuric resistance operon transcriptional regulator